MTQLSTPILFIIFNRLHPAEQVFAAIRAARPSRLYIAADGSRSDRPGEAEKVQAVRDYVLSQVDWDCQVNTRFQEHNLGCRLAVSTAIDWFFEQEPEGIILEDDCLPDASFFPYAETLLTRYRDDQRVMSIAGMHLQGEAHQPLHSYFFSHHIDVWGWASWRRAWQCYDRDMTQWPAVRDTDWLLTVGGGNRRFQRYWTRIFEQAYSGTLDTWDYQWLFSCWLQRGLTAIPAGNLISNIGFGVDATHITEDGEALSNLPIVPLSFPLSHPLTVTRDVDADRWANQHQFKITFYRDLKMRLGQIKPLRTLWQLIPRS